MRKLYWLPVNAFLAGSLGFLFHQPTAMASGFAVPELSALGTGTANALVANPEDPGAIGYNPAAMGFHDNSSVSLGALFIGPSFSVDTASGSHDSNGGDWLTAPMLQAAFKVHEQWRIGFGANAPFGLETRWKFGTFPALSGSSQLGSITLPTGAHPTTSKLELVSLVPTVTYKVNEDLSVSAGIDYYNAQSAKLHTQLTELSGDGDAWGWNASLLYKHDAWSFGASYHSAATVDIEGDYSPRNQQLALLGILPRAQGVTLDLNLPWRLQLGVRYAVMDELAVELDWSRTGWSEFDKLRIKSASTGELLFSETNAWEDSNAYRLGLTYDLLPTTQLRFGYAYDETGQDDDYFSARVPDSDRHLFGVGVGHDLGQGWAVEAGYMYVRFQDHNYRSDTQYLGLGEEVNGTDAIDGDYEASAHLIALEVRKTF